MKMMLAIVNKSDAKEVIKEMTKEGFTITQMASSGGFLKGQISVTLISVIMAERVPHALDVLKKTCKSRKYDTSMVVPQQRAIIEANTPYEAKEIVVGGANVFILNVEETYKF